MNSKQKKVFICFSFKDRYTIAEPLVYHLNNYGIKVWYDRNELLMGDNRVQKNLIDGAEACDYAIIVISKSTESSVCAMEEISIIRNKYRDGSVVVFPILYEITQRELPSELKWVSEIIFKEVDRHTGTYQICNHIACRITKDYIKDLLIKKITDVSNHLTSKQYQSAVPLVNCYLNVDKDNINSRVALLYAVYLTVSPNFRVEDDDEMLCVAIKILERAFSELRLNISIDYRDLWLLENATCILFNRLTAPGSSPVFEQ